MKKLTLVLTAIFMSIGLISQTPQAFKYQAVARDNAGIILSEQAVSFRISIKKGYIGGPDVYIETHNNVATNQFGLVNLDIGNGIFESGVFEDIDWAYGSYFLRVEMDETGGDTYQLMGTSQLMSVPYSMYSETTGDTTRWIKANNDIYYMKGNVGIGSPIPEYKLTVSDDIYSNSSFIGVNKTNFIDIWNNLDGSIALPLGYIGSQGSWRSSWVWNGYRNSSNTWTSLGLNGYSSACAIELGYDGIYFRTASEVLVGNSPTIHMFINNIGDIGIGTSAPMGRLHTSIDNFGRHLKCERTGLNPSYYEIYLAGNKIYHRSDVDQVLQIDSVDVFKVQENGNVAIGADIFATEKLHVNGTVYSSSGGFRFPDGTTQTSASTGIGLGNTLDQAYDQGGSGAGRIITADNGAVHITGGGGLTVNGNIGVNTTTPTFPFSILPGTNTRGINIDHNQSGLGTTHALYVDLYKSYSGTSTIYGGEFQVTNNNGAGTTYGISVSVDGTSTGLRQGVRGSAIGTGTNHGVYGFATGTGTQVGVFGVATGSGNLWAGYFGNGNVHIANKLGIGTESPGAGLHLSGDSFPNSFMFIEAETGGDAGIRLYEGSNDKWHIFNNVTAGGLHIYNAPGLTVFFAEQSTGNVGIGTTNPASRLDVQGNITIRDITTGEIAIELGKGLDYAEGFNVTDKTTIEPGTILCIDPENPGKLKISKNPYDKTVAGIVAGANGLGSGVRLGTEEFDCDVALAGRVYCNTIATTEKIEPGDLLTTSSIPGFAMKVTDFENAHGAIIGKAMQSLEKGQRGQILVLVTLH